LATLANLSIAQAKHPLESLPELDALRNYTGVRKVLLLSEGPRSRPQILGRSCATRENASDLESLSDYLLVPRAGCTFAFEAEECEQVDGPYDIKMAHLMANVLGRVILREENSFIYELGDYDSTCLVLSSSRSLDVLAQADAIADSHKPVLIVGETGVGKELITRYIHQVSGREKFVSISMAQLQGESAVSELFGHVKGAFTGAVSNRLGAFLEAGEGTLFLDEISEMSEAAMAMLLRAIEQKRVKPLGSDRELAAPARIIAATNRPEALRKDLFYRFLHRIKMPPLRERKQDIRAIARFVGFRGGFELTEKALRALESLSTWDGNVRELEYFLFQVSGGAKKRLVGIQDMVHAFSNLMHFDPSHSSIRDLRTALGLSIRKLAFVIDMPKSTLEDIEKGRIAGREEEVLARIGERLDAVDGANLSKETAEPRQRVKREITRFIQEEGIGRSG